MGAFATVICCGWFSRRSIELNVVAIPRDFDVVPSEPFDPVYMKALYDLGFEYGKAGDRWQSKPPDFKLRGDRP